MKNLLLGAASAALAAACLLAMPAAAQSDWTEIASDSQVGVTFYYSPGSVQRNGDYASAKWHDTNHPELIFTAQVECSARTIESLSVDVYNQDGSFKETVDLSGRAAPNPVGPPGTFGANLAQAIC